MHLCFFVFVYLCACIALSVSVCVYTHLLCGCMYVYTCLFSYISMRACMSLYISTHTHDHYTLHTTHYTLHTTQVLQDAATARQTPLDSRLGCRLQSLSRPVRTDTRRSRGSAGVPTACMQPRGLEGLSCGYRGVIVWIAWG